MTDQQCFSVAVWSRLISPHASPHTMNITLQTVVHSGGTQAASHPDIHQYANGYSQKGEALSAAHALFFRMTGNLNRSKHQSQAAQHYQF